MRKALAASFVVTVTAVVGCSSTQRTQNPPPPATATATVEVDGPTLPPLNPPPLEEPEEETPTNDELPDVPEDAEGRVLEKDGRCVWVETAQDDDCPEDAFCNPPPPRRFEVKCPPKPKLPEAPAGVDIKKTPEGECYYVQYYSTSCPQGARCNPPPPRRHDVQCPD